MKLENHYICEPLLLTKLYFICFLVRARVEPHKFEMFTQHDLSSLILPVTL